MANYSRYWLWLLPILLVTAWIGVRGLNADALWFDEYWSVYNAGGAPYGPLSPTEIWERVAGQDPWQAPGYFLLLGGWGALAGWTPFALRALSLLLGLLSIAWAYRLGRDLVSPVGGLAAAVTMGLSAYFLYYFHEMRTYTLVVMLIAMTGWAYWRVAHDGGKWAGAALFLGALGLLYTHYFAALTVGVLGLYHLFFVRKDGRWFRATLLLGAAGLLFLPWLGVVVSGLNSAVEDTLRQSNAWGPRQAIGGVLFMFSNGGLILVVVLGLYSLVGIPEVYRWRWLSRKTVEQQRRVKVFANSPKINRTVVAFAWFWLVGMAGLLLAINARFGVILEVRYLFPLWPALALVMALAIHWLAEGGMRSAVVLMLGVWAAGGIWNSVDAESTITLSNPHWHQPWDVLVEELRPHVLDDDAVLYLLPDWTWPSYHQKPFEYYLDSIPARLHGTLLQNPELIGAQAFAEAETQALAGATRVWLAMTSDQPTSYWDTARQVLEDSGYLNCAAYNQPPNLGLNLFSRGATGYEMAYFGGENAAERITLNLFTGGYQEEVRALSLTAFWSPGEDVPADTYSVGLHVEDGDGQLVAQADYGLPTEAHACRTVDVSFRDLPGGTYSVYVLVYNWQTGERLMGKRSENGIPVDRILLRVYGIPSIEAD